MMKRMAIMVLVLAASASLAPAQDQLTVTETAGKVEIRAADQQWVSARAGMTVGPGDYVSTGFNSTAVLESEGTVLQVTPLTRMKVEELIQKEGTVTTGLFLRVGKVRAQVKTTAGVQQDFKLRSPVSTAAVRGTEFEFGVFSLKVDSGVVLYSNRVNQSRNIRQGEESSTGGTDWPSSGQQGRNRRVDVEPRVSPVGPGAIPEPGATSFYQVPVTITWTWP